MKVHVESFINLFWMQHGKNGEGKRTNVRGIAFLHVVILDFVFQFEGWLLEE